MPSRAKVRFHKVEKERVPFLVPTLYLFEEEEDLFSDGVNIDKHYYTLNIIQRIFITMDHPNSCKLASVCNWTVTLVTLLSVGIYIVSTIPEVNTQPSTCASPSCDNDPVICPGTQVCEPEPPSGFSMVETVCLYVFVVDYFARFLLCTSVPPRLAGVDMKNINHTLFPRPDQEMIRSHRDGGARGSGSAGEGRKPNLSTETGHRGGGDSKEVDMSVSSSAMSSPNRWEAGNFIATPSAASTDLERGGAISHTGEMSLDGPVGGISPAAAALARRMDAQAGGEEENTASNTVSATSGESSPVPTSQGRRGIHTRSGSIKAKHFIEMKEPRTSLEGEQEENLYIDKALEQTLQKKAYSLFDGLVPDDHSVSSLSWVMVQQLFHYEKQWMNIVDFIAIVPFFLSASGSGDGSTLSIVRVLRLARILRVLKLGKGSKGLQVLGATMMRSLPALVILMFFSVIGFILLGSLEFFFEGGSFKVTEEYPDGTYMIEDLTGSGEMRTRFTSIPMSMYWSIITSTGVGYGDIYPTTAEGRMIAILAMYGGIFVLALPISVIGNNFQLIYDQSKGHLSYGVVNAILELMEDDSEELPSPDSLKHDAELVGDAEVSDIGVFKSRRELLEKRASKLASVFVIAQVCLKENEADDINFLLIKVGLRDMIAALEYVYDLDFRQQQLEDFVLQAVSDKLKNATEDEADALDDGLGDASPWTKRGSMRSEGDGTWSPAATLHQDIEVEVDEGVDYSGAGESSKGGMTSDETFLMAKIPSSPLPPPPPMAEGEQEQEQELGGDLQPKADLDKGTFRFHRDTYSDAMRNRGADADAWSDSPSTKPANTSSYAASRGRGRRRISVSDMNIEHRDGTQTIGKRLPIGEYRFASGQTEVDFEQVERDEQAFYEAEFGRLTGRTRELLRYLRKSPDYMETGYLRKLHETAFRAGLSGGNFRRMDVHALHAHALTTVRRYRADTDIKTHINQAKRRVSVAYQRVEMAMHELELEQHIPPNSPMRAQVSTKTPFSSSSTGAAAGAGGGVEELSPMTAASPSAMSALSGDGGGDAFTPLTAATARTTHSIQTTASGYTHVPTGETPLPDDAGSPHRGPPSRSPVGGTRTRDTRLASSIEAEVADDSSQD